jgi:hypothetical protein
MTALLVLLLLYHFYEKVNYNRVATESLSCHFCFQRLAEYFADAAPTAGPYWTAAASSAAIKANLKRLPAGSSPKAALSSHPVLNLNQPSQFIQRPPTPDELLAWGNSISSKQV